MNILLTGASGYFGSAFLEEILPRCRGGLHQVTILIREESRAEPPSAEFPTVREAEVDAAALRTRGIDTVVHLAASRSATDVPAQTRSLEFTSKLLAAAADAGIRRFILASSHAVYGMQPTPWDESAVVSAPVTLHGFAKRAAELLGMARHLPVVSARLAKLVGPSPRFRVRPGEVPHVLIRHAFVGDNVVLQYPDQRIDLLDVRDASRGILALAEHTGTPLPPVINLGSGRVTTPRQVAALVDAACRPRGFPLRYACGPQATRAPHDFEMSIDLARRCLGWEPVIALESTVADLVRSWGV